MFKHTICSLLVTAHLLVGCGPSLHLVRKQRPAPTKTSELQITAKTASGEPLEGALIEIRNEAGLLVYRFATDRAPHTIASLPCGRYRIRVRAIHHRKRFSKQKRFRLPEAQRLVLTFELKEGLGNRIAKLPAILAGAFTVAVEGAIMIAAVAAAAADVAAEVCTAVCCLGR